MVNERRSGDRRRTRFV